MLINGRLDLIIFLKRGSSKVSKQQLILLIAKPPPDFRFAQIFPLLSKEGD
jgi:hypothetical protein